MSDSVTPWTAACQATMSSTISWSLLKFMSIELMIPSNHLILCQPLLLLSIFPSIRVFSTESAFHIKWPKYWSFNFSISPSNEYSGLISFRVVTSLVAQMVKHLLAASPCCLRDSQESSPAPQFESISPSVLHLLYSPILTSIPDYWKNHCFDYMDLCQQNDVSAF